MSDAIKREKKRLPFGWGRFGKSLDRLGELLDPGEVLEFTAIGVYSQYREQPFGAFGAGLTNVLIGVTDRRLFLMGTALSGSPLGHQAIAWGDLTEIRAEPDKKRCVVASWPGGAVSVDSIARSAYGDLVEIIAAKHSG